MTLKQLANAPMTQKTQNMKINSMDIFQNLMLSKVKFNNLEGINW